ncbi:MAG: hypothetical protein A2173_04625 [Planctomycetes bacterium RBG_13_44_8b]|nr:MAG: hypothetical protein A2173_04625 [Planctomycetes bacterium RBG_13_44_8b]
MYKSRIALIGLLISLAVILSGCLVAAVGVGAIGTVAYIKGDLEAYEAETVSTVFDATKMAASELGLTITKEYKDVLYAEIIARDSEDRKTTIKIKGTSPQTTKLSIRVGILGNEARSSFIYQKIHDRLKQKQEKPRF